MEKENNESEKEDISKKIKENLDLVIASGGLLLGIFIICISLVYGIHQQDIGGTIFIASALYILLRERLFKASETFRFKPTREFIYINNIIFFLALSLSVWLLYITLYSRPVIYFILVAVACVSIALEILYSNRKWTGLILIKILLIGITLCGGIYYEFADIYGSDSRFHNAQTEIYIERGHIVSDTLPGRLNEYYYFPIFHTLAISMSILTSLNVYDSIFSSTSFLFVFSVIFVFLLGQKLINTKVGLLAALMLVVGDYRILFGTEAIPMSLGIVFFTIILYLLIVNTPKPVHKRIIVFGLLIVLILTHTVAGFVMLVTVVSLMILKSIKDKYLDNISVSKFTLFWSTIIAFGVLLIGYWTYAIEMPGVSTTTFFAYSVNSLYKGLTYDAEFAVSEKVSLYVATSYFEYFLDKFGYLIFLGTGIVGTYIWFRDKSEFKISLCITMVVLFAFLYGFSLMSMRTIIPTRWFCFVYIILALVSAYGIFKLANLINKKLRKVIVVVIIFLMSFFMITSTISNDDAPLYHKENSQRIEHKTSELQGTATIHRIFNGTYGSLDSNTISSDYNLSKDENKLYILNKDAFKYPMVFEEVHYGVSKPFILNDEFRVRLDSNSNGIYDNGELWGYLINQNKG